ncbi:MAG: hypothetical protein SXG53_24670, partial [Pseudomonadota bacterium]|nr:hypothetical protein [Pseudomonadota bacterium]
VVFVLFGLLAALPYLYALAPDALEGGRFSLVVTFLLLGPVACAVYFLVEQLLPVLRARGRAPNNSPGAASRACSSRLASAVADARRPAAER